jgi:hypothetical protein
MYKENDENKKCSCGKLFDGIFDYERAKEKYKENYSFYERNGLLNVGDYHKGRCKV